MLAIRLSRTGRNKYPTYRIVAAESARAATGKFVAILGHYNPHTKELVIKHEETLKYLSNGAQPSNTVVKLLQREKIKLPDWVELKTKHKPSKHPTPEAAAPPATEPAVAAVDAPAEPETTVATAAADHSQSVAAGAPEGTNLDTDHTDTAASENAAAAKALKGESVAAEAALAASKPAADSDESSPTKDDSKS